MSIQGLNWCIKQTTDTPTTKLVLFILSNYADENGSCYPSEKKLGELVGVSDRQIRRCLTYLIANGLITSQARKGTSNRYFLSMDTDVLPLRTPTSANTKDNTKSIYTKDFNEFWKKYPRKVGKHNAAKSYARAIKEIDKAKLLQIVGLFADSNKNTEEMFIPHAQTWLNGKRYLDTYKKTKTNTMNNLAG
jgi:DNA-binding FadR family transcriptional regulator